MRTSEQLLQYERLELLSDAPKQAQRPFRSRSPLPWLRKIGQWIAARLVSSDEPQVSKIKGSEGHEFWRIYDPVTRITTTLSSEAEVRMWLDQRYYR
jgi:hypothetical protein